MTVFTFAHEPYWQSNICNLVFPITQMKGKEHAANESSHTHHSLCFAHKNTHTDIGNDYVFTHLFYSRCTIMSLHYFAALLEM